jgi:hypothetical protein
VPIIDKGSHTALELASMIGNDHIVRVIETASNLRNASAG